MFLETTVFSQCFLFEVILLLMKKNETEKYYKLLYLLNRPEDIITKLQTDFFTAVRFWK